MDENELIELFKATNTAEPLSEGWPGLLRFGLAVAAAEREACIAATLAERVDFEATGSDEDEVYNTALWHAVEAMQRRSNA